MTNTNTGPGGIPPGPSSHLPPRLVSAEVATRHHHWTEAIDQVVDAVLHRRDCSIVALAGPTGAGKTTALRTIVRRIMREKAPELLAETWRVPFGYAEVPRLPNRGTVFRETVKLLLGSLQEPLINHKIPVDSHAIATGTPADRHWFALEAALENRRPYAVVLDEYHHLVHGGNRKVEENQLARLRSLANRTAAKFLIVGTGRLLSALTCDPEIERRTILVPFRRYRATVSNDVAAFTDIVRSFELDVKIPMEFFPSKDLGYSFFATLGCVGLLANWFAAAEDYAVREGKRIARSHFDQACLDFAVLADLEREAREFDGCLDKSAKAGKELRASIDEDLARSAKGINGSGAPGAEGEK